MELKMWIAVAFFVLWLTMIGWLGWSYLTDDEPP